MSDKIITVIIPVYNREKYLDKCINSVLDQENVTTEIILSDDGSTDNSPQICDEYSKKYPNIKVIHSENHGVGHARNLALDIATGDYVMFLDSDDRHAKGTLSALLSIIEKNDVDFVVGGYEMYSDDYELIKTVSVPDRFANKVIDASSILDLMLEKNPELAINIPLKLFKMHVWKDTRFREDIKTSEDDYLLPTLIQKSSKAYVLDKIVYLQTRSSNSLVRSTPSMNLLNATGSRLASLDYIMSLGKYDVALFRFGDGTRRLLNASKLLDSKEAKKEIKKQYKGYCKAAKKLSPHVNLKNKIRFILFRLSLNIYGSIRDFFGA